MLNLQSISVDSFDLKISKISNTVSCVYLKEYISMTPGKKKKFDLARISCWIYQCWELVTDDTSSNTYLVFPSRRIPRARCSRCYVTPRLRILVSLLRLCTSIRPDCVTHPIANKTRSLIRFCCAICCVSSWKHAPYAHKYSDSARTHKLTIENDASTFQRRTWQIINLNCSKRFINVVATSW